MNIIGLWRSPRAPGKPALAKKRNQPRPRWRPGIEQLEDRTTPSVLHAAPSLRAPVVTTSSIVNPIALQGFTVRHHHLFANGTIHLPGGFTPSFSTRVFVKRETHAPSGCTVLKLDLQGLDLNLLGLVVHLDPVSLLATAQPGPGQLLGNLLCPGGGQGDTSLRSISAGLNKLVSTGNLANGVNGLAGQLANGTGALNTQQLSQQLTSLGVPVGANTVPVLDLRIDSLNLNLLGLHIVSQKPIHLTVVAVPGPGNLLGNLFSQIAHALDSANTSGGGGSSTSTLSTVLNTLLATLLQGAGLTALPGTPAGPAHREGITQPAQHVSTPSDRHASNSCQLVYLDLGPLHLNLLGLDVELNEVKLLISAERGPGEILGNLLCQKNGSLLGGLKQGLSNITSSSGSNASTAAALAAISPTTLAPAVNQVASHPSNPPANACPILHLILPPLDLNLLGLRVQTLTPVDLSITAIPGSGELLGNLLCEIVHLLDKQTA